MLDLTILLVEDLQSRGWTLATAESCTAGRIAQTFADAKGSGEVYVGGVIAYRKDRKATVLGVPEDLLRQPEGAVSEAVAVGMAEGVRHLMGATVAIASTGVAGPSPDEDGNPVGRVYLAIAGHGLEADCRRFDFGEMDADAILARTVDAALLMLAGLLGRDAG
ncbi:CinA family protein [Phreatobacter oligotrophus]|jgi:PncC family amidohydrolase|uniref:CinA family protein n=1 Tax=Phreatobacter oligotrophus TaxID=1122261 RepID=UPI00235328BF|nr:CinA family protein [Phreatobacter oligotrophus]MBX9988931.1 CinA family protein [Phreatobacter oligotrophus]